MIIDESNLLHSKLQEELLQKDKESSRIPNDMDFDLNLIHSNIEGHYGPLHQGSWGVRGHRYSGYIKTIFQRILFEEEYYWIEGDRADSSPIEDFFGREEYRNHLLGLKFHQAIDSKVSSLPDNILEVWLFSLDDERSSMFLLDTNKIWYSYKVLDSNLKADFRVFRSILESYDEWTRDSVR